MTLIKALTVHVCCLGRNDNNEMKSKENEDLWHTDVDIDGM